MWEYALSLTALAAPVNDILSPKFGSVGGKSNVTPAALAMPASRSRVSPEIKKLRALLQNCNGASADARLDVTRMVAVRGPRLLLPPPVHLLRALFLMAPRRGDAAVSPLLVRIRYFFDPTRCIERRVGR